MPPERYPIYYLMFFTCICQLIILLWVVWKIYQVRSLSLAGKKKYTMEEIMKKESLCENIAGEGCGLKRVIDIVGGKWKIMILCVIDNNEVVRYGELNREIHGITNTMLANSLKELEADGLVERKQYDEMPVRVEYNLTNKAKTLIPILLELKKWGEENL